MNERGTRSKMLAVPAGVEAHLVSYKKRGVDFIRSAGEKEPTRSSEKKEGK